MTPSWFSDLLKRPIGFNPGLVKHLGSINAAIFFSQTLYWSERTDDADGWFYKTIEEWHEETALTRHEQATAKEKLKTLGVIEIDRRGFNPVPYFRVNLEALFALINAAEKPIQAKPKSGIAAKPKSGIAQNTNPASHYKEHRLHTETTKDYGELSLHESLDTPLAEYLNHHKSITKKAYTPTSLNTLKRKLSYLAPEYAVDLLETAVIRNWQGIPAQLLPKSQNASPKEWMKGYEPQPVKPPPKPEFQLRQRPDEELQCAR